MYMLYYHQAHYAKPVLCILVSKSKPCPSVSN